MKTLGTVLGVLLVAAFLGCGGPSEEQKTAAADARKEADQAKDLVETSAEDAEKAAVAYQRCKSQMSEFVTELQALDSRLGVGLPFAQYSEEVSNIKVVYDRIPFVNMKAGCLPTGIAGEGAFNSYVDAYNTWNECISDLYCDNDSIESDLQSDWAKATSQVARSKSKLANLRADAVSAQIDADDAEDSADKKVAEATEAESELE